MDEKQATICERTNHHEALMTILSGEPLVYCRVDQQSDRLERLFDAMFDFENVDQIYTSNDSVRICDVSVFTRDRPFKLAMTPFDVFRVVLKDPSKPFEAVAILASDSAESFPDPEGYKVFEGHLVATLSGS